MNMRNGTEKTKHIHRIIIILLICALGIRLGAVFFLGGGIRFADAAYYDRIAQNICAGNGPIVNSTIYAHRMPGYPFFLAAIKYFVSDTGTYIHVVRILQAVVSALVIIPLYLAAGMLVSPGIALIAALLYCADPVQSVFTAFLLPESLFSDCFFMMIFFLLYAVKYRKTRWYLCALISAACGVYLKETMSLFILFFTMAVWCVPVLRRYRRPAVLLLITLVCVLLPWGVRNYLYFRAIVPLTTNSGYTLYDSFNPRANGGTDVTRFTVPPSFSQLNEVERDRAWKRLTYRAIAENPPRVFSLAIRKFAKFWALMPNAEAYRTPESIVIFLCYYGVLFFFFVTGVLLLVKRLFGGKEGQAGEYILLLPVVFLTFLHMIIIGSLKYRMPAEPFIIVIAALGIDYWRRAVQKSCRPGAFTLDSNA